MQAGTVAGLDQVQFHVAVHTSGRTAFNMVVCSGERAWRSFQKCSLSHLYFVFISAKGDGKMGSCNAKCCSYIFIHLSDVWSNVPAPSVPLFLKIYSPSFPVFLLIQRVFFIHH